MCSYDLLLLVQASVAAEPSTPFVRLNEPAPLTPVIDAAHNSHAQVLTPHVVPPASPCSLDPTLLLAACLNALGHSVRCIAGLPAERPHAESRSVQQWDRESGDRTGSELLCASLLWAQLDSTCAQGDRRAKAVGTPFARLRQPAQLTPVLRRAERRHAQVGLHGLMLSLRCSMLTNSQMPHATSTPSETGGGLASFIAHPVAVRHLRFAGQSCSQP